MHAPFRRILLLIPAVLAVLAVAPGSVAQSPAAASPGTGPRSNVSELITFVPPTAQTVGFTDWGRIKASQGAPDLTGSSPIDAQVDVAMSTAKDEAGGSGYGMAHFLDHAATWGWDNLDLDWEATISADGPPLFVLRFRDGFDLAPVADRFDDRGFTTTSVPGAVIRSHAMDMAADWLRATEFAILNTAFLDDGRTLVLSSSLDQVRESVANHGGYASVPGLAATAAALDGASALLLLPGLGTCTGFQPLPIDIGDPLGSPPASLALSTLHPYATLGIGYDRPDWSPIGRIVFDYLDPVTAAADQPGREALARTGTSLRARQPIADVLFSVAASHLDGTTLTLDVAPVGGFPRKLFDMVYARDMAFAGC